MRNDIGGVILRVRCPHRELWMLMQQSWLVLTNKIFFGTTYGRPINYSRKKNSAPQEDVAYYCVFLATEGHKTECVATFFSPLNYTRSLALFSFTFILLLQNDLYVGDAVQSEATTHNLAYSPKKTFNLVDRQINV